jgi:hypothetical protein
MMSLKQSLSLLESISKSLETLPKLGEADKTKMVEAKKTIRMFEKEYKDFLKQMEQKHSIKIYVTSKPSPTFGASEYGADSVAAGFEFRLVIP